MASPSCATAPALPASREEGRDQAARLLPAIATVLGEAGVGRRDLSLIAVTIGPGSFTGVRVGLAAARGLAVGARRAAGGHRHDVGAAGAGRRRATGSSSPPSTAASATGSAPSARASSAPFVASATRACRAPGAAGRASSSARGAEALAPQLVAAGVDAMAEEALPDPVALARLAVDAGVEAWRARNAREGLPRPLYLRGVNITLPDGARRTVD